MSDDVLALLLSKPTRQSRSAIVVAHSAVVAERFDADVGTDTPDRDLPRAVKELAARRRGPTVVVTGKLSPTLLRALRTHPPALVVVTADVDDAVVQSLDALPETQAIGPRALLRRGDGTQLACGASDDELRGLLRALGMDTVALGLAPTPPWLVDWLAQPSHSERSVAGTIDARQLPIAWAAWARTHRGAVTLVPVGVPRPSLSEPRHVALSAVVAAHALERLTGPVFPSPRVIATVLAGLSGQTPAPPEQAPTAAHNAIWAQARRALPMTGSILGMDVPQLDPSEAPTAVFLAQRAVLRATRGRTLMAEASLARARPDADGIARAEQLLTTAGEVLTDHESKVVLRGFGIEVTRQAVASSASGATGFADRIGYPVVLKALSPGLRRRSDIGAVELQLGTGASVRRAYASIVDNVEQRAPTARLDGVLVAEMVPAGLDVHCGVIRLANDDGLAIYGRTIEASAPIEPAMALLPLDDAEALLLAHAIVTRIPVPGLRRQEDPDVVELAQLLRSLAAVAEHASDRVEAIELSPVRLVSTPRRTVVLDATIRQRPHLQGR